ncbi:MAG: DNA recombination protein RmuC [Chromatiales bacterium]|nr:DNA recombination protein RmuC [Chromatiales bacterium]
MNPSTLPELLPAHWLLIALAAALGALLGSLFTQLRAQGREGRLREEVIRLETQLRSDREQHEERLNAYDEARDQLTYVFNSLSKQALVSNNEAFLDLARERLEQQQLRARDDLSERERAIAHLVTPIRETLEKAEKQLREIEQERQRAFGSLNQHLETVTRAQQELQAETRNLSQALRRPEVRGRWGELTLRRLVELAGMAEHCDFTEQASVASDRGNLQRPDMVIHLPDEREIVVDVKTPLDAYLSAVETSDPQVHRTELQRHARHVRERVRELSAKAYWQQFARSPDFVVLFIPGEQFLSAALEQDRDLLEEALARKIIITTPTSLIAVLRAIAFSWRQLAIVRNADRIRATGEDFYRRLGGFLEHLATLGRNLDAGVASYNRALGSLERQLMPKAKRFAEMGIGAEEDLRSPSPIEKTARIPSDTEGPA